MILECYILDQISSGSYIGKKKEGILEKLAPIFPCNKVVPSSFVGGNYPTGIGFHDSSAALIPYLVNFHEPFVLISTGTWGISSNPFNRLPLTKEELKNDCLCFLTYEGKHVKASRLFAGNEHEQQVKRISDHFNKSTAHYRTMEFNPEAISTLQKRNISENSKDNKISLHTSIFAKRNLNGFANDEEAYHQLMLHIIAQQFISTELVLKDTSFCRFHGPGNRHGCGFCHS